MATTYTVTLVPSEDPAKVSNDADEDQGGYAFSKIEYVVRRTVASVACQEVGEMVINDTGNEVDMDHEWSIVPNEGDLGIEFSVGFENGKRRLFYTMTAGANATMWFQKGPNFG